MWLRYANQDLYKENLRKRFVRMIKEHKNGPG
jgi:hypothetical protein